jgi:hypothetical protein
MRFVNEFDLQMWERELSAWQRRLQRQPPGPLRSLVFEIATRLHELRAHRPFVGDGEPVIVVELGLLFSALRAAYEDDAPVLENVR